MASNKVTLRLRVSTKNKDDKTDSRISLISPILGPRAIKPIDFLKMFDSKTSHYSRPVNLIVHLKVTVDKYGKSRSFNMSIGNLSVTELVKQELNIEKLPSKAKMSKQTISNAQIDKIVSQKKSCFMYVDENKIRNMVLGSLKSMHIHIKD